MRRAGSAAQPPGWDGEQRGEPGIHGLVRARRWDVVTGADAPELTGDEAAFVALPGGALVSEAPPAALAPLAAALAGVPPPYRAEAVRRQGVHWAIAASRIRIVEAPGLDGDEAEVVVARGARTVHVDGRPRFAGAAELERVGREHGDEFVVRARRLAGDLWEVDANPL